ncbi:hypothetical protein QE152_g35940 [Popillia japonica]|uniref:Uncharacterized protein n=1 Tax=Popillia japonica TaxID=7064 RepID=A0AAW1IDW5_POPJA
MEERQPIKEDPPLSPSCVYVEERQPIKEDPPLSPSCVYAAYYALAGDIKDSTPPGLHSATFFGVNA